MKSNGIDIFLTDLFCTISIWLFPAGGVSSINIEIGDDAFSSIFVGALMSDSNSREAISHHLIEGSA